jgi:hypothetical protein
MRTPMPGRLIAIAAVGAVIGVVSLAQGLSADRQALVVLGILALVGTALMVVGWLRSSVK